MMSCYLVTGATGNVGSEIVRALASAGQPVRALTREPSTARLPAGVEPVGGDLNQPGRLSRALDGVDAVFLLAGYADPPGALAELHAAGVRRVVLLSSGAVVHGNLDNCVVRCNVVSEAAVGDSGLDWTVLRPSGFMSNALRWVPQLKTGDTVREPFAEVPVAVIDPGGDTGRNPRPRSASRGPARRRSTTGDERRHARGAGRCVLRVLPRRNLRRQPGRRHGPAPPRRPLRTFTDWAGAHADAFR